MKGVPLNEELYNYIVNLFAKEDEHQKEIVKEMEKAEMPLIQVSPENGKFLFLLAKIAGAKNALEIGTLGGYSSTWIAKALPEDGKLITIEVSEKHRKFASEQFKKAGLTDKIEIRYGKAMDILSKLNGFSFDFAFIDADKESGLTYYNLVKPMMNKGGIIAVDNALRDGNIVKADADTGTKGMQELNEIISKDPTVESLLVPISDGLTIAWIKK